jgi:threonine/homoserine/homoserine lactone efflux protein
LFELPPAAAVRWGAVGQLLLTSLAIMGSPGPATISLLAVGSVHGVQRSIPYLVGIIVGTMTVLVAVATGTTAVLLSIPAVGSVLTGISVAYILWLAFHIARAPAVSHEAAGVRAPSLTAGALLGVANPKAWVALAAVFASARLAGAATTDAAAKVATLSGMIVVICGTWLIAGKSLAGLFTDPRRARGVNLGLALVLVAASALAVFR